MRLHFPPRWPPCWPLLIATSLPTPDSSIQCVSELISEKFGERWRESLDASTPSAAVEGPWRNQHEHAAARCRCGAVVAASHVCVSRASDSTTHAPTSCPAAFDATAHTGAAPRPSTAAARRSPPARAARHASTAGSSGATSATGRQPARSVATAAAAAPALTTEQRATTAVAFATALDAGSSLPVTWMSHWQQQAELQVARRVIINATRGRQQQRHREVSTLLALGSDSGTSAGTTAAAVAYQAQAVPERASPAPASADAAQVDALARLLGSSTGSLDMPPLQEMSEVDQLTWLASHPQLEEEPAVSTASLPAPNGSTPLWMQQGQPQPQQQPQPQYQQTQQQQWRRQEQPWEGALDTDASGSLETATLQGPVQLRVDGDELNVRPLWIAVFQPAAEGPAK